jgi:hypothetical protein
MAKRHGSQEDFLKIPILGLVPESSATGSPPGSPVNGQLWFDTTVGRLFVREAGAWVLATQTGTVLATDSAGGDITGVFSNLQIGALAVGTAELAADAVTYAKMQNISATNRLLGRSTAGAGDPEEITLDADHAFSGGALRLGAFTGDITKSAGSLATTVGANAITVAKLATSVTLNAIAAAYPTTADLPMSGFKITGLGTPTAAGDAATKAYVDNIAAGLDPKGSVRAATTAAIAGATYTATGGSSARGQFTTMPNAIDGVTLAANDRVLVKNQGTGAQNGIWVVTTLGTGANGVWDRAADFDQDAEVTSGAFTFVEEGTTNDNTGWVLTTNNPITIGGAGGTSLAFTQFSGGSSYTAGTGLTLTTNSFSVVGTANRISVSGAGVDIAATYVGQTSITTLGTITTGVWNGTTIAVLNGGTGATTAAGARTNLGAAGKFAGTIGTALVAGVATNIVHNLGSTDVIAAFKLISSSGVEDLYWQVVDANTISVTADVAYLANTLRVTVVG